MPHHAFPPSGAGTGGLGLAMEGPSEVKMTCKDNRDGSCTVEYIPLETGKYDVSIKFADQHIPGSPFKVGCWGLAGRVFDCVRVCLLGLFQWDRERRQGGKEGRKRE